MTDREVLRPPDGAARLSRAQLGKAKYVTAHPNSQMGDPNYSDYLGYDFVAFQPDGLMVYRRQSWLRRFIFRRRVL